MPNRTSIVAALGLVCLAVGKGLVGCRAEPSPGMAAADRAAHADLLASTDDWHAERLAALTAEDGWLTLVALEWLEPGRNRVGRAPSGEIVYDGFPADLVGAIVVDGDRMRFEPAAGVPVRGVPADGVLQSDAGGTPTVIVLDRIRFHIIERGGRLGVRIKDAAAPTRVDFEGIERFPVASDWQITAAFTPADPGTTVALDTVVGLPAESAVTGRVRFERDGVQVDALLFDAGDGGSLLRFADATNGADTYGGGRYLYVDPSRDGRSVVLDFNRAYSPPCAFTPFATCSIPLEANTFPFPVDAGERSHPSD